MLFVEAREAEVKVCVRNIPLHQLHGLPFTAPDSAYLCSLLALLVSFFNRYQQKVTTCCRAVLAGQPRFGGVPLKLPPTHISSFHL